MTNWRFQLPAAASLLWTVSACTQDSTPVAAQALQEELTSADVESVACTLFSRDQIAKAVGATVDAGVTSGPLGTGCSWAIRGHDRSVMVQIVPRDYWKTVPVSREAKRSQVSARRRSSGLGSMISVPAR